MTASGLTTCSPPSSSGARIRHIGDTSICAPTRATVEPSTFAPSSATATSLTSLIDAPKPTSSSAIRTRRHGDGSSRSAIAGFNRFRKLLVRYEKLERSFVALNHLAAAIIAFRKVPADVDISYG